MMDQLLGQVPQALPPLDAMYWVNLTSRVLHIFGAIILVGGLFYLRAVVWPAVAHDTDDLDRRFGGRRTAWAMWVGIASLLLLVTGFWNYLYVIRMLHEPFAPSYHMLAGVKILAGIALFFIASMLAGRSAAAETLRRRMLFWLRVCLLLGLLTVILGSVLRSYPHVLRAEEPPGEVLLMP